MFNANTFLSAGCHHRYNSNYSEEEEHEEKDFDSALGVFAGDLAGNAVDENLEGARAVIKAHQPNREEEMFEGLGGEIGLNAQVPMGIAGNLTTAERTGFGFHSRAGGLGGSDEVDLVLFDGPAGDVAGGVWF